MKTTYHIDLPSPAPGTRRTLRVHRYGAPGARPKAYLHAGLHADEHPGFLVLHHLSRLLDRAAEQTGISGEIVLVPVANPLGLTQHLNGCLVGRFDFESGANFNRDFPDLAETAALQVKDQLGKDPQVNATRIREALLSALEQPQNVKESQALKIALLKLSIDADYVLDLHCDSESLLHLYASYRHRDTAAALGAEIGAAVVLLEEEAGGNPFDESNAGPWWKLRERLNEPVAIPLGCFATTVELRGQADVSDAYAENDAACLFRFLQRRGLIAGDPGPLPSNSAVEAPLEGVDILTAPVAGIVAYHKELGDRVEKGEVVAELVDPTSANSANARVAMRSQTSGVLFARVRDKLARPGQNFCKIAGTEKLAYRIPGKLLEN